MKQKKLLIASKYVLYAFLLLLLYVLQNTPLLFELSSLKPILLLPAVICIALWEGEFAGGLFGAFAGLLSDLSATPIFGFYAIFYLLIGTAVGLCVIYLMRSNLVNFLIFTLIALLLTGFLNFFFCYLIWNYENVWRVFFRQILPTALYSFFTAPFLYLIFRYIYQFFEEKLKS